MPVCCGFSSRKGGARGRIRTCTGDVLNVVSLLLDYASKVNWGLPPVLPRQDFLYKGSQRLPQGGEMVAVSSAALDTAGL